MDPGRWPSLGLASRSDRSIDLATSVPGRPAAAEIDRRLRQAAEQWQEMEAWPGRRVAAAATAHLPHIHTITPLDYYSRYLHGMHI